ncbi:cofactor-independent phosphoglycerate mutase [Candidatus Saganbacteria bacterium]|nr:cofactor-independent phosphoglycerate mutase [Candidatus Saganbacteria bacterium]
MKYLVLIGDGMSDHPLKELGGKTPLEYAQTPNMDFLAKNGLCGWVNNVPKGMSPGSDVAAMSIFGYDPKKYYTGRGPLEAASLGIKLKKDEVAFRCNLVTIEDGKMADFTSGHITTKEADQILKTLNKKLGSKDVCFVTGLSYRHLLIIRHSALGIRHLRTTPPHDITGKLIEDHLPNNDLIRRLMKESIVPLLEHPVNKKRIKAGKKPASMIWLWGQGAAPNLKPFKKQYGKSAAVITAVHLLKGLGKILGMEVINVPGATGFLDTNYKGKAQYALRALQRRDLVLVHVEAPDEAGHMGDVKGKVRAIEDFDAKVVGTVLSKLRHCGFDIRILILPDHPTPIKLMTHTAEAVPFVIYQSRVAGRKSQVKGFNENAIKSARLRIKDGWKLMGRFLR